MNVPSLARASEIAAFETECARIRRDGRGTRGIVVLGGSIAQSLPDREGWVPRAIAGESLLAPDTSLWDRLGTDRLHPNPDAIVVLAGEADVGTSPDATPRIVRAFTRLLTRIAELHPGVPMAVVSLLPRRGPGAPGNRDASALNAELRELARTRSVAFWDVYAAFVDPKKGEADADDVRADGSLTRAGAKKLGHLLASHAVALGIDQTVVGPSSVDRAALGRSIVAEYGAAFWADRSGAETETELVENHVLPEIDFLTRYLETGASVFRDLYLGSRARFFAKNPSLAVPEGDGLVRLFERDARLWTSHVAPGPHAAGTLGRIERAFESMKAVLPRNALGRVRLLFIGDCLLEDVELLLGGSLLVEGLVADVDFVLSKNPVEQTRMLAEAELRQYDAVVYSPLTWDFDQEFKNFLEPSLRSGHGLIEDFESIWSRVDHRVRALAASYECPVLVHNTAAVVRAGSAGKRAARAALTPRRRQYVRRVFSERLGALVAEVNQSTFHHVVVVDEAACVRGARDEVNLGRFIYYAGAIHPTELSVEVARRITTLVAASRIASKKVVVCDLDNTLWDGVIGEGLGVDHHRDRQLVLQELKKKGVVLAICSKNDPANVVWQGSVLGESDFVASEISWGPKALAMKRIQESLNLKLKDFIFIDDRADEREMVMEAAPGLLALDPGQERTWELFRAWAELLGDEGDRTRLYHERAQRETMVSTIEEAAESSRMFSRLGLKLEIREARSGDLKRAHELVNRTSQWNLTGARYTYKEMLAFHESKDHLILVARVSDKFGDMGIVSSAVAEFADGALHIRAFVLSCRVFGYGVETRMLRSLAEAAIRRFGESALRGYLVETSHNKPCRLMYPDHGFEEEAGCWRYTGNPGIAPEPTWFGDGPVSIRPPNAGAA